MVLGEKHGTNYLPYTIKKFAEQVNRLNMEENQETEIDTI